ncbi:6,7-dimethyl-8-ribityllumazine synthase [Bacteroidia bacterium]|nr:6,7-dimethyl-8-ribityllumazine synthase [Bacteroidia bacterium]
MATEYHLLSDNNLTSVLDASAMKFAIVVSEWNSEITLKLKEGAQNELIKQGAKPENITVAFVPGSFELIYGAKRIIESVRPNAIIGLGCVIKGDTPHFDYVCSGVTQGFAQLNADGDVPCIFGVLTTNTLEQSLDRAGGKLGNKGEEAAITAIKMVQFACKFK